MRLTWYGQLGFKENPFTIKPSDSEELIGYDIQKLGARLDQGGLIFIEGVYGTGKTSLLRQVRRRFSRSHKVLYCACNAGSVDFDQLLSQSMSLLDGLLGREPRGVILLLDEAQELSAEEFRKLNYAYQRNAFKSVVLMADSLANLRFQYDRMLAHCHSYRLDTLTPEQSVWLVRQRVGALPLLSDEVIRRVFYGTGQNPRRLLKHCEAICKYAVDHCLPALRDADVRRILEQGFMQPRQLMPRAQ